MAARKAEEKRRGHRAAVPPARPMRRHRPREGGKRSIGRERLPDSHVPPSPIPWKRARNQPGMYFVGNGRKIAHVANGVIRTGKNDSGASPRTWGCFSLEDDTLKEWLVVPPCVGGAHAFNTFNKIAMSSPRAWGCFFIDPVRREIPGVFPTHVGVFPTATRGVRKSTGLPHARGAGHG